MCIRIYIERERVKYRYVTRPQKLPASIHRLQTSAETKKYAATLISLNCMAWKSAQIRSLNYAVSSCYRKICNVKSNENVRLCMDMFNCDDVAVVATLLTKRKQNFASSFARIGSILCELVVVISN